MEQFHIPEVRFTNENTQEKFVYLYICSQRIQVRDEQIKMFRISLFVFIFILNFFIAKKGLSVYLLKEFLPE